MARKNLRKKHHNGNSTKLKTNLQSDFKKLKVALNQATRHAKGNATKVLYDRYEDILDKSTDIEDNLITYTRRKPIKSLGLAVLAGLTIGFLFRK